MNIKQQILKKLMYSKGMSYNALRDEVPSNKFTYHLNQLVEDDIIKKEDTIYTLTAEGTHLISSIDGQEIAAKKKPIVCSFVLAYDGEKILLNKRLKQPFYGYVGVPGGKIEFGSRIPEEASRELLEETGLSAGKMELKQIVNYRTYDDDSKELMHQVIGFFFLATELKGELKKIDREGENFFLKPEDTKNHKMYPDIELYKDIILTTKQIIFKEADRFMKDGDFIGINILD